MVATNYRCVPADCLPAPRPLCFRSSMMLRVCCDFNSKWLKSTNDGILGLKYDQN